MADVNFKNLKLVDRKDELKKLKNELDEVLNGRGKTIFISGEAGIGKTRIVEELISHAMDIGFRIIRGKCIPEHLEPLFPFKSALKKADLEYLLSEKTQPIVLSAYLISDSALVISKAERKETGLDPDIFVGMLKAIEAFVKDSMKIMEREEGNLNSLSYGDYTILIQSLSTISLAVVIKGEPNEFLIEDMKRVLKKLGEKFKDWSGEMDIAEEAKPEIEWFIKSGKYDAKYIESDKKIVRFQESIFDNIVTGLQRISQSTPLIIFIDDLQWADQSSLNFLYYLSQNIRKNRIMIIGTYRPEDIIPAGGKLHPLEITLNNLAGGGLLKIMGLQRLNREDTTVLIGRILGDFDNSLASKIYKESGGNPLFVIEIIKLLISEKIIYIEGKKWKLRVKADKIAIPKKAYEIIKRRLERLTDEEREILDVASVIGEEFDTLLLAHTTGMEELKILKKLNRIYRKHKLIYVKNGKYRFEHSIIREVLYNEILDELRRKYHKIIGDAIYELNRDNLAGVVNLLAYHYYEAKDKKAVKFLIEIGNQAKRNYANNEAMNFYTRALEITDEPRFKVEILENIGDIMADKGEYNFAEKNYREAMDFVDDKIKNAHLKRKLAEISIKKGDYNGALKLLDNAKKIVVNRFPLEEGRIYRDIGNIYFLRGEYENAFELFKKALKIFAVRNNKKDIADIFKWVGNVEIFLGNYEKSKKYYIKALQIMKEIGDIKEVSMILNDIGDLYLILGNLNRALKIYYSSLRVMENIELKSGISLVLNNIGNVHFRKGNLEEAIQFYMDSLKISEEIPQKNTRSMVLNNMGNVYYLRGEFDKAMEHYTKSLEICKEIDDKYITSYALLNIAHLYFWKGKIGYAYKIIKTAGEIIKKIGDKKGYIESLLTMGEIKLSMKDYDAAINDVSEAMKIAQKLRLKNEEMNSRIVFGMIHREKKEFRKALIEFTKAINHFTRSDNKIELARAYYEYALLWKKMNDLEKEREFLKKALDIYSSFKIRIWEEKCKKELKMI